MFGIALIAAVDFFSGVELRTFPLYYGPIAVVAWHFGQWAAIGAALLAAAGWFVSNQLAGLEFSHSLIWVANTLVQAASFATVGVLVARLRAALVREHRLGRLDPLSGLLNSRAFYEEGDRLLRLCRRTSRPITIAYMDLDNFKAVNDSRGHQVGDDVLRRLADQLCATLRGSDIVARLGGDEFAILFPELGSEEAGQALDRLHVAIAQALGETGSATTATIGAAVFVQLPDTVDELVQRADSTMYAAKQAGKNRVRLEVVEPARQAVSR